MRQTIQNRLNRVAFVGYHSAVTWGGLSAWGLPTACLVQEGRADMDVSGLGSVQGAGPIRSATPANAASSGKPAEASAATTPKDELELSAAGVAMDRANETPEMRAERLAQIKEAIDNGSYESDEKLDAALSRMFDSFGIDLDDE